MNHRHLQTFLSAYDWQVFDEKYNPSSNLASPLAYQDSFIRWIPEFQKNPTALLHLYPFKKDTVLLGARDTRLPKFEEAANYLFQGGYDLLVRSHGGLAVVADSGIANISIVSDNEVTPLSIDEAYEVMVALIQYLLANYQLKVTAYEVPDSYCPGKFDLVVDDLKIGGIAQRRFKSGVTTAAYLSINGYQDNRAHLINNFYRIGQADDTYPEVNAKKMTTIQHLINQPINLATFNQLVVDSLKQFVFVSQGDFQDATLQAIYQKMLPIAQKRTKRFFQS